MWSKSLKTRNEAKRRIFTARLPARTLPCASADRLGSGAIVGGGIRLFLDARVDPRDFVEEAPGHQAGDQKINGDETDDDVRRARQAGKVDDSREPKRDDDSNDPIFRSDIPVHGRLTPFLSAASVLSV